FLDFTCGGLLDRVVFCTSNVILPYIHRLRKSFTTYKVFFLCNQRVNSLLHPPEIDEITIDEGKFLTREEMERRHIKKALAQCRGIVGGKQGASKLLGIPRSTLQYRMKKLGISNQLFND
ncbi:MAG: helix-turn-helix domain-containing protein, partial [Desulfobacteraceae bacterium]|nr:helix-turn-helix domain-containing protein [Desulfobacteraceae bacterium]